METNIDLMISSDCGILPSTLLDHDIQVHSMSYVKWCGEFSDLLITRCLLEFYIRNIYPYTLLVSEHKSSYISCNNVTCFVFVEHTEIVRVDSLSRSHGELHIY
jgi:hypothetical protein